MAKKPLSIFEEYAQIQHQINELSDKKEALRLKIAAKLPPEGEKFEFGTFFFKVIKKWTYSPATQKLETELNEKLKKMSEEMTKVTEPLNEKKKMEQEKGVAIAEEVKQLNIKIV